MPDDWVDRDPDEAAALVKVGIETDRGSWVAALVAAGYEVFAINPLSVARYRERHSTSGAKSDAADAHLLAEIVRLDRAHHRPVAEDTDLGEAIKLTARTHQSLIWDRSRHVARLRSTLREYFPAALLAFDDLDAPDALELLGRAPDPDQAARLSSTAIIRRAETRPPAARRGPSPAAAERPACTQSCDSHRCCRPPTPRSWPARSRSSPRSTPRSTGSGRWWANILAGTGTLRSTLSLPGLGVILAARILGEFGDDPDRYADAKARKNYAGTSPITRASGTKKVVLARYARNRRLGDALQQWAFCSLRGSPGATAYYQQLRDRKIGHQAALRQLANRLVGILHGCLKTHTTYDEHTAWAHHSTTAA